MIGFPFECLIDIEWKRMFLYRESISVSKMVRFKINNETNEKTGETFMLQIRRKKTEQKDKIKPDFFFKKKNENKREKKNLKCQKSKRITMN